MAGWGGTGFSPHQQHHRGGEEKHGERKEDGEGDPRAVLRCRIRMGQTTKASLYGREEMKWT